MRPRVRALAGALLGVAAAGAVAAPASAPASLASADLARGEQAHARCLACHALAYDRVGPHHCGLLGRRAGTVPGFDYSAAMRRSGITWDEATLDRFLAAPTRVVPGTSMTYDGVADRQTRTDLIAWLRHADGTEACRAAAPSR